MSGPYISMQAGSERFSSKPKKLGWFKRWFFRMIAEAQDHTLSESKLAPSDISWVGPIGKQASINTRNSIDMSLVRADGGWIVQFQSYDERTDRTNVNHYVIPDSEDFGQRLSEIITLQCMR
jgi:hypothetical protein